jgi:hypothetical protein
LARSDRPNRIFDAVRAVVADTGVLGGIHRRALDSVVLDDAVATQLVLGPPGGALQPHDAGPLNARSGGQSGAPHLMLLDFDRW